MKDIIPGIKFGKNFDNFDYDYKEQVEKIMTRAITEHYIGVHDEWLLLQALSDPNIMLSAQPSHLSEPRRYQILWAALGSVSVPEAIEYAERIQQIANNAKLLDELQLMVMPGSIVES